MLGEVAGQVLIPGVLNAGEAGAIALVQAAYILHQQLGIVGDARFGLQLAVDANQRAAANGAAHGVGLFQDNNFRAVAASLNGGAHAGHASANHQHVGIGDGARLLGLFFQTQRVLYRGHDALGGEGGAGYNVHIRALGFHDFSGNLFHRSVAYAGGIAVAEHLNLGDLAALDGHGNLQIAAKTGARAFEHAVRQLRGIGCHAHQAQHHDQRANHA